MMSPAPANSPRHSSPEPSRALLVADPTRDRPAPSGAHDLERQLRTAFSPPPRPDDKWSRPVRVAFAIGAGAGLWALIGWAALSLA